MNDFAFRGAVITDQRTFEPIQDGSPSNERSTSEQMRRNTFWSWAYRLLGWWQWVAGIVSATVTATLRADASWYIERWAAMKRLVEYLQNVAPILVPVLLVSLALAELLRKSIGPPFVWPVVQRVLDQFQSLAFSDRMGPLHHHRVTLFREVRLRHPWKVWPWSRCLKAVARSGHTTQRSTAVFRIPDDAEKAEGIAGRTWSTKRAVQVDGLPDLSADPSEDDLWEYSRRTFVTPRWLQRWRRREITPARSFYGIPVEVRNKFWGVLVLDSREERPIGPKQRKVYNGVAKILGAVLEGVKR